MQPEKNVIKLNGAFTANKNYLWGGALTLAWQELKNSIIKEDIRVRSDEENIHQMVENFNKCPFNKSHLTPQAYYIKSGFGQATVDLINHEVSKKFPEKTTAPLQYNLQDSDIISFAYFFKKLKFPIAFHKDIVRFNGKEVQGFRAKQSSQKKQVLVNQYKSPEEFIVSLLTKQTKEEIFLIKSEKEYEAEDIVGRINDQQKKGTALGKSDIFQMPNVSVKSKRIVKELINKHLANEDWKQYRFADIYEIIKLEIDSTGVKVENEGAMIMTKSAMVPPVKIRKIILDRPFWIVMRETGKHPYLVAFITDLNDSSM